MQKNQFIDLEAQTTSDEELSEDEGLTRRGDDSFLNDAPDDLEANVGDPSPNLQLSETPPLKENYSAGLHNLIERIEHRHVNNRASSSQGDENDNRIPHHQLFLQENDWNLWRIKCTAPTKKYNIIYELMKRHETLSGELHSTFYNPRDSKYIYLEAKFTKFGISSLYEVLREFSALKRSSLAPVPEPDLKQCLTIGDEPRQVFTAGQWVQIKQGLYRGDIGFLVDEFPNEDLITLFTVLVIPRLQFAYPDDDEGKSLKRQWKRQLRPSPRLFNPDECKQEDLMQQGDQIYSSKHYSFKYGLQVKIYSECSLSPADEISPLSYSLFKAANDRGAEIDMSSIPTRSFWRFEPGERVVILPSNKIGIIASSFNPVDTRCQVELEEEGVQLVLVKDIKKDIVPGHYVELLAGIHTGKKGFVIGRTGDRLAIWFENRELPSHINSVRLSKPDFCHTETPWLNVHVKLMSGPLAAHRGVVTDVVVTSSRSLAITVRLLSGDECIVGYHAVREFFTGRLLLDHQPLKRHQQHFNVELPWKEVEVEIQSGRFANLGGIVKNIRVDFRSCLRLLLWVPSHNCSTDIDYSAVLEKSTRTELQVFRPLEGYELTRFGVNPSIESMRSGPIPWLGLTVDIVAGEYKGTGVIRDVNCFRVDPNCHYEDYKIKPSGLTLSIERYLHTAAMSFQVVKVDYDAVRFHKTNYRLCEVFMPTARQSFYMPDDSYQKHLISPVASLDAVDAVDGNPGQTPRPNDFERETIFCGSWSPNCPTPRASSFYSPFACDRSWSPNCPTPAASSFLSPCYQSPFAGSQTPVISFGFQSPVPWTPASPSPPPASLPSPPLSGASPPAPSPPDHWILHPKLVGIPIRVDITGGGELDTSAKKNGAIVETVTNEDGLTVLCRKSSTQSVPVHYQLIQSFRRRPIPAKEKNLMVVVRNHEQIGKLVRRYHHFYLGERIENNHWMMIMEVDRSGREEKVNNYFEVHPHDVEYVYETPAKVRWGKELFCNIRQDYKGSKAEVRTLSDSS